MILGGSLALSHPKERETNPVFGCNGYVIAKRSLILNGNL